MANPGVLKRDGVRHNRSIRLRNGRVFPLRDKPEPPQAIYFGVRFSDGHTVFMPRSKHQSLTGIDDDERWAKREAELRAHALSVRGIAAADPKAPQITGVAQACIHCVRANNKCDGCAHSAGYNNDREAEKKLAESNSPKVAPASAGDSPKPEQPGFADGGKPVAPKAEASAPKKESK